MPFQTEAGGPTAGATTHLPIGEHLVKIVDIAPYQKQGADVKTMPVKILGNDSIKLVFCNADGAIDADLPLTPPPGTGFTEEGVRGNINALAQYTGVVPDAIEKGIPSTKYKNVNEFLRDILNRGNPIWIKVGPQMKNGQPVLANNGEPFSSFKFITGPQLEGEEYQEWGADSTEAEEELPF